MTLLRALRAYIGLGPDEEVEGRYLDELNARRRALELDEIDPDAESQSRPRRQVSQSPVGPDSRRRTSRGTRLSDKATSSDSAKANGANVSGSGRPRSRNGAGRPSARVESEPIEWGHNSPFEDAEYSGDGHDVEVDEVLIDLRRTDEHAASPFEELEAELHTSPNNGVEPTDEIEGAGAVVRSLDVMRSKPKTVLPDSFADAKDVADEFKRGIPIVLNLQTVERELARRLIDFASGVCYSLDGSMEKLASQVFLLVPEAVEVSDQDRRLIVERGYAR